MTLQIMSLTYGLPDHPPHKLKVLQMLFRVRLATLRMRVERHPIRLYFKEFVAWVENFLGERKEKVAGDAAGIDAWFVFEYNLDRLLDLFACKLTQLFERRQEYVLSVDTDF